MESNDSLRDLDRAAALPFIDYPRSPWWYPFLMGGLFAAMATGLFLWAGGEVGQVVAALCVFAAAIVSFGLYLRWYRSRWGTWPEMSEAPAEIQRAYRRCAAAMLVALVLIVVVGLLSPPVVTVVVTFTVFTALIWGYERKVYPAACADVRARLA